MTASPNTDAPRRRVLPPVLTAVLCVASSLLILQVPPARAAALPAPVMRGYVPLAAVATQETMNNAKSTAGKTLDFTVGITNGGPGAVMYYDHWEDGFEADLANPTQETTEVWGDDTTGNGDAAELIGGKKICAPCTNDTLPAGAVFVLRNDVLTPRNTAEIRWDGGDRVSSTRGFTITAGGFTTTIGPLLSASASAYDTTKWGTDYWIPVGENMTFPSGTSNAFATTSVQVMADQPGTVVTVDRNKDGTIAPGETKTIGPGEVFFVDGGVQRGTHVLADKPVQVHVGAGDPATPSGQYELRWFTLFPTPFLSSDYLNPVGSSNNNQRTITYLFNPSAADITVTPICNTGCSGTINVPANSGASYPSPLGNAVRFVSTGAKPFVAVGAGGSESGASPGDGSDQSASWDWGFTLVPTGLLTTKALLGWAPGNSAEPPSSAGPDHVADDPVWISALGNTTLYVDYDGNPATGPNTAPADCLGVGGNYDRAYSLSQLESKRISDTDGDMTGANIYTCDGTKIAGAWGQDPATAPNVAPGFDAGYTLIPSTTMLLDKTAGLASDANGDGKFGPDDEIGYEVAIANAGSSPFTNLQVSDAIPPGTAYVANSTTFSTGGTPAAIPDDAGASATPYPFDEGGRTAPPILEGQTGKIRYRVKIDNPYPAAAGQSITNLVKVDGVEEDGEDKVTIPLVTSDLSLAKVLQEPTPRYLGDNAIFDVVVRNDGPDAAQAVVVDDLLPAGLEFVSAEAGNEGSYDDVLGQWTIGDMADGAVRTLRVTAKVNVPSAVNKAEIASARTVDPDSTPGNGSMDEDDDAQVPVHVDPIADLELTKVLAEGQQPDAQGNTSFVLTIVNNGPGTSQGVTVTEQPPPAASFVSAAPLTNPTVDGSFASDLWTVPDLAPGRQAVMRVVYRTPVAHEINYVQVATSTVFDPDSQPGGDPLSPVTPPDQDDEAKAEVPAIGDVKLTNQTTQPAAYVGDTVKFTVTVTNEGPTDTTGVNVLDKLPEGLEFVSADPSAGGYDGTTGVWNVGNLAEDGTQTLVITARVLKPGPINTTAEVTSSTAQDKDSTPNNHIPTEDDQADAPVSTTGASLGDTVWYDTDLDYVKDPGEPGLPGVKVTAHWAGPNGAPGDNDDQEFTTVTDANGAWSLTGLPKGPYEVTVDPATLPQGITTATRDRDGKTTVDTTTLTLDGGANLTDVDFAYVGAGRIGDAVFLDTNGNGVPDAGEGIPSVTVNLTWNGPDNNPGTPDDIDYTTVTDPEGRYLFPNLPAGKFEVEVVPTGLPAGVRNAVDPEGPKDNRAAFDLAPNQEDLDLDFGNVGTNTIGDRVFTDINGDGIQQPGEPGLGGVTVTLERDVDGDGTFEAAVGSRSTAGNGDYLFEELPAARYRVVVTTPTGLDLTTPEKVAKTVTTDETILDADFGLEPPPPPAPGKIGDLVWDDRNGNGVPDPGEPGIPGAKVTLWETGGPTGEKDRVVATQTTDPDGKYTFENLPPAGYRVTVTPPDGYQPTTPVGIPVPVDPGASIDTADFGLTKGTVPNGVIGDFVWNDGNGDGIQDPGEPGLADVALTLRRDKDGDGVYETGVATTKTDPDGRYSFEDLPPGAYRVVAAPPASNHPTVPTVATVNLGPGQAVDTADFGFTTAAGAPSSIGDRIWLDSNRDGQQDPDEPGVNDVTVALRSDPDGDGIFDKVVTTQTTTGDGNYEFPGLAPGLYLVTVTPPDGLTPTVPPILVPLPTGRAVVTADLGLATPPAVPFDLAVVKAAETTPLHGHDMTWRLTVTNNGIAPSPATLTVTDTLPAGLAYRSASGTGWSCSAEKQVVACSGTGPLAPGATSTFRIVTDVSLEKGREILNGARVDAAGIELTQVNNESRAGVVVGTPPPILPAADEPTVPLTPAPAPPEPPAAVLPSTSVLGSEQVLPRTGSSTTSGLSRLAGMLIGLGLGLSGASRRRRRP